MPSSGRGFDSPSPLQEPDLWRGTWSAKPRIRVRFPAGSPLHLSSSARWLRLPDPHSGDAGSNPAGDAARRHRIVSHRGVAQPGKSACSGNRRSPVRIRPPRPGRPAGLRAHLGGARPGGRAHQSIGAGAISRARARSSPCPGGPGTVLRTRLSRFNSSQGGLIASVLAAPDARSLRSLTTRARLPAEAPCTMCREGQSRGEAHTLAFAGSTPASASATTRGEGRLP